MLLWGSGFGSSKVIVDYLPHRGGGAALRRWGPCSADRPATFRRAALGGLGRDRAGRPARASLVSSCTTSVLLGVALAPAIDGGTIVPVMSPVLTTSFLLAGKERASSARVAGLASARPVR